MDSQLESIFNPTKVKQDIYDKEASGKNIIQDIEGYEETKGETSIKESSQH